MKLPVLNPSLRELLNHVGLLAMRVGFAGFMAMNHGWGKLMSWSEKSGKFADPLGVGHAPSLALAIFGELVCPLLIMVGFGTRLAAVPAAITMLVATFGVHGSDVLGDGEHALLFAFAFTCIALLGPGRYSIDARRGAF